MDGVSATRRLPVRRRALRGAGTAPRRRRLPLPALPAHDGHAAAYTACAHADLVLTEAGGLRWYDADGRSRGFCGTCGASLFWRAAGRETTSIAAGTLDEPTGLRTIAHIHTADQGDYYVIDGEGECFERGLTPPYGWPATARGRWIHPLG